MKCRKRTFRHRFCSFIFATTLMVSIGLSDMANAQTASFRSIDTNSDGVLGFNELVAAFGEAGARRLIDDIDRNGDSRITIWELRQSSDRKNEDRDGREDRENRNEGERNDDNGGSGGKGGGDDRDDDGGDDNRDDDGDDDGDDD